LNTLALVNKKDVSDCIETNSIIGVDQLGAYMLGQMTLAIELHKIIGHQSGRQATCGEPIPEDK
jgi:hypothetical protein